uniref:Uncharacterized protein n=1 Tax=Arundo donax TaxID=35708 RepID=A0A0A9FNZ1_ARUDO
MLYEYLSQQSKTIVKYISTQYQSLLVLIHKATAPTSEK